MSEDKVGAQSSESVELVLGKKTGVPASSKDGWKIVTLPICSYPRVNLCGYEYGSPAAYPLENPYLHGGYGFFGGLGTGTALDTCGLPVLLPSHGYPDPNPYPYP